MCAQAATALDPDCFVSVIQRPALGEALEGEQLRRLDAPGDYTRGAVLTTELLCADSCRPTFCRKYRALLDVFSPRITARTIRRRTPEAIAERQHPYPYIATRRKHHSCRASASRPTSIPPTCRVSFHPPSHLPGYIVLSLPYLGGLRLCLLDSVVARSPGLVRGLN